MKFLKKNALSTITLIISILMVVGSIAFAGTTSLPGTRTGDVLPKLPTDVIKQLPEGSLPIIDLENPKEPEEENIEEEIPIVNSTETSEEESGTSSPSTRTYYSIVDIFARIDGIQGESLDSRHKDEIDIKSFSFEGKSTASPGTATSGKPQFNAVKIVKMLDKSSPILLDSLAKGKHIKEVKVSFNRAGRISNINILTVTLRDVLVTEFRQKITNDGIEEEIGLSFKQVGYEYVQIGANGAAKSPIRIDIDLMKP